MGDRVCCERDCRRGRQRLHVWNGRSTPAEGRPRLRRMPADSRLRLLAGGVNLWEADNVCMSRGETSGRSGLIDQEGHHVSSSCSTGGTIFRRSAVGQSNRHGWTELASARIALLPRSRAASTWSLPGAPPGIGSACLTRRLGPGGRPKAGAQAPAGLHPRADWSITEPDTRAGTCR